MAAVAKQDPIDAEIGARVHQYLWMNRVPQNGMAALIQISGPSLGRKLRGDSAWTAGELHRLARLLGVSVSWLYGETEEEPARPKGLEPLTFWSVLCGPGAPSYHCPRCGWPTWDSWLCRKCRDEVRADDLALTA